MIYYITNQLSLQLYRNEFGSCTVEEALKDLETYPEIGVDTETEGFSPHTKALLLLQLGDYNTQYVIDATTVDVSQFKPLLEKKLLVFANAQFDLTFLEHAHIRPSKLFDVMLAEVIMTTGFRDDQDLKDLKELVNDETAEQYVVRGVSLQALGYKYCDILLDKDVRGLINKGPINSRIIQYAANDVKYLLPIKESQLVAYERFKEKFNTTDAILDLENEVVKVLARINYNGINIDRQKYEKEVSATVNKEVLEITAKLNDIAAEEFKLPYSYDLYSGMKLVQINWDSPAQKLRLLKKIAPDLESTNAESIAKHLHVHKIFGLLADYNKLKKLESSFGTKFLDQINPVTGRMHTNFWQIVSTGRMSSNNPNLNQIPRKGALGPVIRSCFIPKSKDYVIVGGDFSGMELRIIAEFSQDPLWIQTFNEGGDLHTILCAETFGIDTKDVKKPFPSNPDITYRDLQKSVNFGLAYGMSEYKLSNTARINLQSSKDVIKRFFKKVPKVQAFLDGIGRLGASRGYIKTSPEYGRVRQFPKWNFLKDYPNTDPSVQAKWLGEIERASKNTPIQGANADVIKKALIYVQTEIDTAGWDARILLSVYDEIQTECHRDQAEEWQKKLTELMIMAAREVIKSIPVVVDTKIAECWTK